MMARIAPMAIARMNVWLFIGVELLRDGDHSVLCAIEAILRYSSQCDFVLSRLHENVCGVLLITL